VAEDGINSHIQMPKSVLKRFENLHHKFFYYDVKNNRIGNNGHAGSINTSRGFFSKEIEIFLNANVEKPLSNLFSIIDEISIDPPKGHIDSKFDYVAKRFVYALLSRNPDKVDSICDYPSIADALSPQQFRDIGAVLGLAAEIKKNQLDSYGTTIAVNSTIMPFVLPTCGAYYMKIRDIEHVVLPVSPKKAIVFVEEKGKDEIICDGIVHPYSITDILDVHQLNIGAVFAQCRYGNGYVVSPQREALEYARSVVMQKTV